MAHMRQIWQYKIEAI